MPTYQIYDTKADIELSLFMSYTELEKFLEDNPHMKQGVSSPAIVSGRGMGKPDSSFRDLLGNIKKKAERGIGRSSINTF